MEHTNAQVTQLGEELRAFNTMKQNEAAKLLELEQEEDRRSPRKARRSSIGDAGFDTYVFDNNVGHRITPEQKFASYERARVKEAFTKVRHVEECNDGPVKVEPNGTVYFNGKKYSKLSCCGTNTGAPALRCFTCCKEGCGSSYFVQSWRSKSRHVQIGY